MTTDNERKITQFLATAPRYRIVIDTTEGRNDASFDVGAELSYYLQNTPIKPEHMKMAVPDALQQMFRNNTEQHPEWGKLLRMSNLAILFEPALGLDIKSMIQRLSQNTLVLIKWNGEVDDNHLYFLKREDGYAIDLTHTNHIFIS